MDYSSFRRHYRANHRTLGCRISHMIAIPMILCSLALLFFSWERALILFVSGWAVAFSGHFLFEKNRPVLFAKPANPLNYVSGVAFVAEEWAHFLGICKATEEPAEKETSGKLEI